MHSLRASKAHIELFAPPESRRANYPTKSQISRRKKNSPQFFEREKKRVSNQTKGQIPALAPNSKKKNSLAIFEGEKSSNRS